MLPGVSLGPTIGLDPGVDGAAVGGVFVTGGSDGALSVAAGPEVATGTT